MARKTVMAQTTEDESDAPETAEQAAEKITEERAIADLTAIINELPSSGVSVQIFRRPPDSNAAFAYIRAVPLESFSIDMLATDFGGGSYRLRFYHKGKIVNTAQGIEIDSRIRGKMDSPAGMNQPNPPQDPVAMFRAINEMNNARKTDPAIVAAIVAGATTLGGSIITAFANRPQPTPPPPPPPQKPLADLIAPFVPIALALINRDGKTAPNLKEQIEVLKGLKELTGPSGDGNGEQDSSVMGIIGRSLGAGVEGFLAARAARQQGVASPSPTPEPARVAAPESPASVMPESVKPLDSHAARIFEFADKGMPPAKFVGLCDSLMTEEQFDEIGAALEEADWMEKLFSPIYHPEIGKRIGWFGEVRKEFAKAFEDDSSDN